ncbi:hypothetical protein GCM10027614_70590 [Micromonospora vulcania]
MLVALGEPHSARGWAAFAYAATTRLHGRSDPRTVAAAATLAAVLHRVGSHSRAARLYQEVIIELTAQDGPESLRVLAAHADLATVEYARGQCTVARDRLQDAWELHREVYGDGHPSGIKMLARLGAMQRDCGQFAEAHDNLALARELCRQHLPADDPLAAQVASLARAAANPDHVCADDPPAARETPVVPAARTPGHGDEAVEAGYLPPEPAPPHHVDPMTTGAAMAGGGAVGGGPVPNPRAPADEPGGSAGFRWPPTPADEPTPHATEAPVPPSVVGLTGSAEEASGVYRLHRPGAPAEPYAPLEPYRPSRLLPVPVHRAPPPQRNRLVPVLVAGVVVVLLGTAAVIAGVARVGDRDDQPPPATGSPAPARPARARRPPAPPRPARHRPRRHPARRRRQWTYATPGTASRCAGRTRPAARGR